jgi:hypothetical protein
VVSAHAPVARATKLLPRFHQEPVTSILAAANTLKHRAPSIPRKPPRLPSLVQRGRPTPNLAAVRHRAQCR